MKIRNILYLFIGLSLMAYIIISFTLWSWNVATWSEDSRVMVFVLPIIILVWAGLFGAFDKK